MNQTPAFTGWIEPQAAAAWPFLTPQNLEGLRRLETALTQGLSTHPTPAQRFLAVRRELAPYTPARTGGPATVEAVMALAGFICGWHDLNLRDTVGPGHGRMILHHAAPALRATWAKRLGSGDLVGIAATERHGGSRLTEITTRLFPDNNGWRLSGEKCWVSRLEEAAAFVVFAKDPSDRIQAAVVPADAEGVTRYPETPSGLGGWAWGTLALTDVSVSSDSILTTPGGDGEQIFRTHFAAFRPLVASIALGTAAGVHSRVRSTLHARTATRLLPRVRDTALVTLGRTQGEIHAGLLAAITAARLTAQHNPQADMWARSIKVHGVETAHRAVQDLAPLVGASGFRADSPISRARTDLGGLLYADGIHDALLRSVGRTLLST
ncbi:MULTISPECIES: acyl-CoA dehydrogenase [unclassified Streptomyces]|uniref:acyl-CoA dehydrogenase n=1 Tax=unclassified Streptomyces TaxID=2593676 RepID=UPI002365AA07|nr:MULTISPECIES: acyl-CoA dehydrogenase [unclassified Streptomyces]MDF3149402.1 acyl-CoA dehydrogenase [Streptomyces sp. T21Q-yed]WDF45113.1 acyl-CoA dehydrogenase [Streptomyces sp. T12]